MLEPLETGAKTTEPPAYAYARQSDPRSPYDQGYGSRGPSPSPLPALSVDHTTSASEGKPGKGRGGMRSDSLGGLLGK